MFTEAQLEEYVIRRSLSEAARNVIRTVRSSPPTRRVKSGYSSVSCRYPSLKMGWVIQAESNKNELPAVVGWDFDKFTHEIYDQPTPVKMTYHNATGRKVTHMSTPDYFLLQDEFTGWIECKTEDWLKAKLAEGSGLFTKDENGKWRCLPGEQYAAELGLGFRVRSSAESNWVKLRNIEFLTDYYDERCPPAKDADIKVIRKAMGDQAWITVKQLLDSGCSSDALYTMVTDGLLFFDLDNFLITEPERAQIFRDAEAFDTYRIYLESQRLPAVAPLRSVQLVNGTVFNWDGKPWRILNVGNEDVFMEDDEHVISSLKNNVFVGLAKKGVITGLPESVDVNREEIDQLIRSAGPSDLKQALIRYRCLFPDLQDKSLPSVTDRSIRNWRSLFRKSEQAYGSGFFGLISKIHLRGNRKRKIDPEVIELMESEIDLNLQPEAKSWVVCWGAVRNLCIEKGLAPPSEVTFRSAVKSRRSSDIIVAREGEKAAYSGSEYIWYLEATSPRHGERPFEIGHIDHTQLDLQFVGARNGEKMGKAWLTVLIDAFTRVILAWVLMFDEPSYRSCMAVIRECVKRHGRIPKNIVVDNGADFDSEYFECLLPRLGATKKTRPGNKPRFGSIIERFFGLNNEEFVHNLIGNNKALQKPRSMSATHDPRDLAVWTLPAFTDGFEGFLTNAYSCMEHSALGMSPKDAMTIGLAHSGTRQHKLIPYTEDFVIMCLPSTKKGTAKVDAGRGVKIGYIYFWTPEFRDPKHAKTNVPVRYDPFDMSTAFVWLKNRWVICRSELAAQFQGRTEKEVNLATQELRARQLRSGSRRALNAQIIAAYFVDISATQAGLRQKSRSQDSQDASNLAVITPKPLIQSKSEQATSQKISWGNLNLKILGDF